ncbi:glutathione S-transferase family protein [Thalassomonas sp. M1454]|uniref:glutathione S-transferase family protein n=1 Tax=Thalassomonas sp. M1454 TaxID=2594477 RepID=UPI0011808734|nr:glutathione S-transferase family protein [Thalassomonas sp. M1454]TRX56512.1 glutathione S-transferase family protein [Thalassomonas sp. M1454]
MHLYTHKPAPNPQRLDLLMKYKGIEIDTTPLDMMKGEHFCEELKALNPSCTLPTLHLDDGTVLTDTVAICYYLDKEYPEKALFGNTPLVTAQVLGLMHKFYTEGMTPIAEMLRNRGEGFKDRALPGRINVAQIPELVNRGKVRLDGFWLDMDEKLAGKLFLIDEQLTQADIDLYVVCSFAGWAKQVIPSNCANILAWHKNIETILQS